jgi:hypothetical protein
MPILLFPIWILKNEQAITALAKDKMSFPSVLGSKFTGWVVKCGCTTWRNGLREKKDVLAIQ